MRYERDFPAKTFLLGYLEDFEAFLARAEEMGDQGTVALRSKGHALKGPYRQLFQFNMPLTRAFGFRYSRDFIIVSAAMKKGSAKAQESDYKFALKLRANYLEGIEQHEQDEQGR
jgi:hypothetical protein